MEIRTFFCYTGGEVLLAPHLRLATALQLAAGDIRATDQQFGAAPASRAPIYLPAGSNARSMVWCTAGVEGEGGFIAREGIEHSQNRQPDRCIPCHADVVGELVRRVAVPAAETKLSHILLF